MPAGAVIAAPADEQLMMLYVRGDLGAFEMLYRRHKDALFGYLLRASADREVAAELFQDVWARLIRGRDAYKPSGRFASWLYSLAHNRLMDHFRLKRLPTETLDEEAHLPAPSHQQPERQTDAQFAAQRILHALANLPEEQRAAFLLKEEAGLSLEEIAEVMKVGRETIKSRLRYALAKLRLELADV
jgi:RNA polymerase sigma-70 factor (ECF subfamily)